MEISFKRVLGGVIIMLLLLLVFQIGFWHYQRRALAADLKESLGVNPDRPRIAKVFFEYKNRAQKLERLKPIINFNFGYNKSAAADVRTDQAFAAYCDYLLLVAGDSDVALTTENQKTALDSYVTLGCGQ